MRPAFDSLEFDYPTADYDHLPICDIYLLPACDYPT